MAGRSSWRRGAAGLVLEAAMVVFAVLVALAVDEWKEGRELQEQVDRARAAVEAELRSNRAELEVSISSVRDMSDGVADQVRLLRGGQELTEGALNGDLPDFSDAAWETARVTGTVARMDYEWVLSTARVYETQRLASEMQNEALSLIGAAFVRRPDLERFEDLLGQFFILIQIYDNLGDKYEAALSGAGRTSGPP